jgi:polyisoprenoid-binding protein YceI
VRSPFLAAIPPAVALAAGLLRWHLQGSGNLYTQPARRAYVADPDLGWRLVEGGPPWLGLEVLGLIAGVAAAIGAGAWLVGRLERRGRRRPRLRALLWAAGALPLSVPMWAFAGGLGPPGAVDARPAPADGAPVEGIAGALDAPAGRWQVLPHAGSAITARVSAGGEVFEARFAGDLTGHWTGDPRDLSAPMHAEVSVAAASVDTGVAMRSRSARDDYLQAAAHPRLGFRLDRLRAAAPLADGRLAFRAAGTVGLIGGEHAVEVTGTLGTLDATARARQRIAAPAALLVDAHLTVRIAETALAPDAGDFDGDEIPVHVTLVLVPDPTEQGRDR